MVWRASTVDAGSSSGGSVVKVKVMVWVDCSGSGGRKVW